MSKKSDVSSFITASVGGHPSSIYSANQAASVERFKDLLASTARLQPDVVFIGERGLSRRKARKLANRYRGSSRGQRYAAYLRGDPGDYMADGKRLVSLPKFSRSTITTVHSCDAGRVLAVLKSKA